MLGGSASLATQTERKSPEPGAERDAGTARLHAPVCTSSARSAALCLRVRSAGFLRCAVSPGAGGVRCCIASQACVLLCFACLGAQECACAFGLAPRLAMSQAASGHGARQPGPLARNLRRVWTGPSRREQHRWAALRRTAGHRVLCCWCVCRQRVECGAPDEIVWWAAHVTRPEQAPRSRRRTASPRRRWRKV